MSGEVEGVSFRPALLSANKSLKRSHNDRLEVSPTGLENAASSPGLGANASDSKALSRRGERERERERERGGKKEKKKERKG